MEMKKNQNIFKIKPSSKMTIVFFSFIFATLIFIAGFFTAELSLIYGSAGRSAGKGEVVNISKETPDFLSRDVDFNQFWQVWKHVKENYVDSDIPDTKLFYGALAGIVASLGDPYSVFLDPEVAKKFQEEISGSFEGIGAEIGIKDGRLTIVSPLPQTPAEKAGLMPGDRILAIDDYDTTGIAIDLAVSKIRGPKGTEVILTILSEGQSEPKEISITRDKIQIDSVIFEKKDYNGKSEDEEGFVVKEGNIAYIQLRYFNENTLVEWNKIVQNIIKAGPKGIILDLRNNPGGFLATAIEIAGEWANGRPVVLEKLRNGESVSHKATRQARFEEIPTVVLVNGGSASGAEIVAGALQDYGLATLVGQKTFGKGSVQDLKKLKDGSSVKLTIAEWFTPLGRNINKEGIEPDVEVERTREDFDKDIDPQLDKAIEILKNQQ